ncbi:MAG: RNase adapter RapZ, partial [Actinobacteria bacterium]
MSQRSERPESTSSDTQLVVVTGLSGGGRSTVARALENVGFYVVDNLPQALLLDMAELAMRAGGAARRTAMVLDVRSRAFSTDLVGAIQSLKDRGFQPRVVFVDADDEVLIRRFESVRRSHPLQGDGRLTDGIAAERELLAGAREQADVIIDTTHLNVNQLRRRVEELFGGEDALRLRVTVLSFGFKYGLPPDADFVLDARFLPNPYWVPELRDRTGREAPVSEYVLGQQG